MTEHQKRKCLKCNKNFKSLGKFNRICEPCTENNKHYDDINNLTSFKRGRQYRFKDFSLR